MPDDVLKIQARLGPMLSAATKSLSAEFSLTPSSLMRIALPCAIFGISVRQAASLLKFHERLHEGHADSAMSACWECFAEQGDPWYQRVRREDDPVDYSPGDTPDITKLRMLLAFVKDRHEAIERQQEAVAGGGGLRVDPPTLEEVLGDEAH